MEEDLKYITVAPHIRARSDTSRITFWFIVSLLPAVAFAVYKYKIYALRHLLITVAVCICTDFLYCYFVKNTNTIKVGNAAVTGILLALLLPAYAPWYVGAIGGVFAILIAKHLFGGQGKYIVNPAVAAKCFLMLSCYKVMQMYAKGSINLPVDNILHGKRTDTFLMMIGDVDGSMGEVCAVAILIGAVILVLTGVIDVYIPAAYIAAFIVMISIFGKGGADITYIIAQLAGGGFLLAVWFIATDYATSPITVRGQLIYGIILGVLSAVVRIWGNSSEELYYILLICNLFVPLIERFTIPKPFNLGGGRYV